MKTLVTFPIEEKYKEIGNEILGADNIIWYPQTGKAEIFLIRNSEFPRNQVPKFIQATSAGTDHIDMRAIPKGSVLASNAGAYSLSVAEHVFALLLERMKKIGKFHAATMRGIYEPEETTLLFGKTIGIIGYGGIGSRVAYLGKAFGMRTIAIGRGYRDKNADIFLSIEEIDTLLMESDFIVISIPLTKRTYGFIGKEQLNKAKKNCIIVNVARPEVVRKEDMIDFVNSNKTASYLTDVWWGEPDLDGSGRENVVITPHIAGGLSGEIKEIAFRSAFENIKRFIDSGKVLNVVNTEESIYVERGHIGV